MTTTSRSDTNRITDRGWKFVGPAEATTDRFHEDGFLCLNQIIPNKDDSYLQEWREWSERYFADCFVTLFEKGHTLFPQHYRETNDDKEMSSCVGEYALGSGGVKNGFREVVMRSPGRYELSLLDLYFPTDGLDGDSVDNTNTTMHWKTINPSAPPPSLDTLLNNPALARLVPQLLQEESLKDLKICHVSLLVATPSSTEQAWHSDGGHVDLQQHRLCHVLNVFLPLVDVPLKMGPTEFRPGSQFLTRNLTRMMLLAKARKTLRSPVVPVPKAGDAVIFDYRVLHRGQANRSERNRTVLVLTFAKSWYKDVCNFPQRSMHTAGAVDT